MTLEQKFIELQRLIQDRNMDFVSASAQEEQKAEPMFFIVTDNSSSIEADFSAYAKLA